MKSFMKMLTLSALLLVTSTTQAGENRLGDRVNTSFTAIQGNTVGTVDPVAHPPGTFWMEDGRIYKCYKPNIKREVLLDVVDPKNPNQVTPSQVWTSANGELLVQDGRYTLAHSPVWHEQAIREYVGTGRVAALPAPILPNLLPHALVPETIPVDRLNRYLVSEWVIVSVKPLVWFTGTIEVIEPVPYEELPSISPTPDPFFQLEGNGPSLPPLTVPSARRN